MRTTFDLRIKPLVGNVGLATVLFSFILLTPLPIGAVYREDPRWLARTFVVPFATTLASGLLMWYYGRLEVDMMREREAFAAAGYLWLLLVGFGALPYVLGGTLPNGIDAYFESMSGFVTCGNTVIMDVEAVPHSILFWRSTTQWVGGLGILVLSMVILSRILGGSLLLFKAESPGHTITRLRPKIRDTARLLWGIYLLYTVLGTVLLWGAGMDPFDSVNHSMTALATGGFSTKNASVGHFGSPLIEGVLVILMLLGSTNFNLHYELLRGKWRRFARDEEARFYLAMLAFFTGVVTLDLLVNTSYGLGDSFRYSIFQVVSMNGTVGFLSTDIGPTGPVQWPGLSLFLLVVMMLIGACTGSTGGGIKAVRLLILLKAIKRELGRILHPRAVMPIRIGKSVVPERAMASIAVFMMLYILVFFVVAAIVLGTGPDLATSMSASASALGNVGAGIGKAAGTFTFFHPVAKIALIIAMWFGRLEIYPALMLIIPTTYGESKAVDKRQMRAATPSGPVTRKRTRGRNGGPKSPRL